MLYDDRVPRTGRPRAFERIHVLEAARDLFWARGYRATSVQDLVDHLALQRGSLYGAFGDKHTMYLEAVTLYIRDNRRHLEAVLADGPVLPALRQLLTEPAALTGLDAATSSQGCLVGNTTVELVPSDDEASALVSGAYDGVIDVVANALRRGQLAGEISTAATPVAQAQLVLLLLQGSALIGRADKGNHHRVVAGIHAALDALAK